MFVLAWTRCFPILCNDVLSELAMILHEDVGLQALVLQPFEEVNVDQVLQLFKLLVLVHLDEVALAPLFQQVWLVFD